MIINRHHQHHQSDDAYITAIFWAFFSLGRLTSIFLATKFSASFMIFIDIVSIENNFESNISYTVMPGLIIMR